MHGQLAVHMLPMEDSKRTQFVLLFYCGFCCSAGFNLHVAAVHIFFCFFWYYFLSGDGVRLCSKLFMALATVLNILVGILIAMLFLVILWWLHTIWLDSQCHSA